ncbi:MAG TPA: RIP metalloprotease RseP [Acholeplasmatales bacterium]|nr:RIP metalloprotease RseP [Acholeplasmatales bacterium]
MWNTIGNILLFILVLSVVICIHELGHFYFAKKAGILCHEFSFGMGPRIISKKFGETTFSIRAFPFGGFVTMAGEELSTEIVKKGDRVRLQFDDDMHVQKIILNTKLPQYQNLLEIVVEDVDLKGVGMAPLFVNGYPVERDAHFVFDRHEIQIAPYERSFVSKTKAQRFMVTFAGAMMNIILAFAVYLFIALAFGVPNDASTVVATVSEGMPAHSIVLPGDEIVAINGISVSAWRGSDDASVTSELAKYLDHDTFVLTVRRDGIEIELAPITPIYYFYGLGISADPTTPGLVIDSPLYAETELMEGDVIVSIDDAVFTDWADVIAFSIAHPDGSTEEEPTKIVVERDGVELAPIYFVAYGEEVLSAMGYAAFYSRIGIGQSTHFALFQSFSVALQDLGDAAISIYRTLWLLISGSQVKLSQMSGFIGIYAITANAAAQGLVSLLSWVGLLSVNLGIVNLLPIPALDGGRLAFIIYEAITKKKPNQKVENWLHTIVFFLLIGLLIFITFNDILRLFTNG